jgi:hypothetical protein
MLFTPGTLPLSSQTFNYAAGSSVTAGRSGQAGANSTRAGRRCWCWPTRAKVRHSPNWRPVRRRHRHSLALRQARPWPWCRPAPQGCGGHWQMQCRAESTRCPTGPCSGACQPSPGTPGQQPATTCAPHAASASLLIYGVSALYFETDVGVGSASAGSPRNAVWNPACSPTRRGSI